MSRTRRNIPLARPSFGAAEEQRLLETLRSGWVTQGPRVVEFEQNFAALVENDQAVATSSATTALFLSLHVLGIRSGDEVIAPAATFIASVNAVSHTGATPVLVDVDPRTYNLDPARVADAISARTKAIMVVHQLGLPAELDAIEEIGRQRGIPIVEDSACALGSKFRGKPIGSSTNLGCFSFHPRKVVVTGEGGMIVTSDRELAERLRRLRHQGMSISDLDRHHDDRVVTERYNEVGYNFRLSDLHAAVGLAQLERLDELVARRRALAARYDTAFADDPVVVTPFVPEWAEPNYQSYIIRLSDFAAAERDAFLDAMQKRGVATRRGLMAVHREAACAEARVHGSLEHSERIDEQSVVLPIFGDLSDDDQDYVIAMMREALEGFRVQR